MERKTRYSVSEHGTNAIISIDAPYWEDKMEA